MDEHEALANALVAQLSTAGVAVRATGAGVHWHVDIGPVASRTLRVHCFWYERRIPELMLGMNPANARSRLRASRPPYEGPEYLVILHDDGVRVADGRTGNNADVIVCARAWLAGLDLEQVVREVPFVDEKARRMRATAALLPPHLRHEIGGDPAYELWVYGDGRSCEVLASDDIITCSFLLGQAQVAYGAALTDLRAAVEAWLITGVSVHVLATHVPGVELECYADVLEADPARWHWLHLRDRVANPRDLLYPLRQLVLALAESPTATTFYSFSSMSCLCFSASSHYPWVRKGLPTVVPVGDALFLVDKTPCDLGRAVQTIETTLAASPIRPFFGSTPHYELPLVAESLARQGSLLCPRLVQRQGWYDLVVEDTSGKKRCSVSGQHVTFTDATSELDATWPKLEDAVRAIHRYAEDGTSLDEIATDPHARRVSKRARRSTGNLLGELLDLVRGEQGQGDAT